MGTRLRAEDVRADRPGRSIQVEKAEKDRIRSGTRGRAQRRTANAAAIPSSGPGILDIAPREDRYIRHMPFSLDNPCSGRKPRLHIPVR